MLNRHFKIIFKAGFLLLFLVLTSFLVYSAIIEKLMLRNPSKYYKKIGKNDAASKQELKDSRICGTALHRDLTTKFKNPKTYYKTIELKAPQDEVGDVKIFNAIDFSTENQEKIEIVARAERKGEHAYVYVDTTESFKDEDLDELLFLFDNQIYPINTEVFGSEPKPGIDGDLLITILLLSIDKSADVVGDIAGYFWSGNQFSKSQVPKSNEREMLYIDIARLNRFGVDDVAGTIAHEFQHLIHWNHDRNEEKWINEGLSEYAIFINGFSVSNNPSLFLNDTDITLMSWSNHPKDYARSFLWILYLADHYGGNALVRSIVANPNSGISALQMVLDARSSGVTVTEIFSNWILANYLDYISEGDSLHGYLSLDLPTLQPTQTFGFLPVGTRTNSVNAFAADYYLFNGGENLVVNINGPNSDANFKTKAIKIKKNAAPEILDFPLNSNNDGMLPLLDFGVNFDQFVLIPYYVRDPDISPLVEYEFDAEGTGGPSAFTDTVQYHDQESNTIIALGLPSPVINSEHLDSYAVRFTVPSEGFLIGAELAVWRRVGTGGTVRFFAFEDSQDSSHVPVTKLDSVDVQNVTGTPGTITWNSVDFSGKNIAVKKGENIHVGWEFVNFNFGDTVFAILDTAKVPTNRTSVFVRERQRWSHFVAGFNFFLRAIFSIPADPTVPKVTAGLLQNPVFSQAVDIFTIGENSLNPVSVEGTFMLNDSAKTLKFRAADDSNKVFIDDQFKLFDSGSAELIVSARHAFGTIIGSDTLKLNIALIDFQKGGTITSTDGNVLLKLPPHVISKSTYFTTMSLEDDIKFKDNHVEMANNMLPTGLSYTIAPSGINFEKMVELTFFYEDNDMAILSENDLAVAYLDNNNWVVLGGELYRDEKSITVLVNRTGSYSLIINKFTESENELEVPSEFYLQQNYPNPFNPKTTIRFGLPKSVHTIIRIINLKGQIISTLIDETLHAGEHVIEWNGTDDKNVPVASGVYLYQLQADDFIHTRKLVLVK